MTDEKGRTSSGPVLVTGASGFIGGRVARLLSERGEKVRAMCRATSDRSYLEPDTEWLAGDIRNQSDVRRAADGCSAIFHCAGLVGPTHYRLSDFEEINVGGTRNVMESAAEYGIRRVVHTSSIAALGGRDGELVDESISDGDVMDGYATSKRASEEVALAAATRDLSVVVINPAVVYGPRDRYFSRLIEMHVKGRLKLIAFPDRALSLAFIDDVARAHISAMERAESGQRFIVSSPTIKLCEFLVALSAVSGVPAPRLTVPELMGKAAFSLAWGLSPLTRFRPPLRMRDLNGPGPSYDGRKTERELGIAYTPLQEGLAHTVRWLRSR